MTAWAFASAGHAAPAMFDALAEAATPRARECSGQAIANLAWAYATARHASPSLYSALASMAASRARDLSPQAVSNIAWSFATASHPLAETHLLLDALGAAAQRRLGRFKPQELANLCWAFARVRLPSPSLLDALAEEAARRLDAFSGQGVATLAWSYATLQHAQPDLFDAIAAEAAPRLRRFSPQAISTIAWAFATAGRPAPALFEAIADEAAPRLAEFAPQGLANLAWAFATVGEPSRSTSGGEAELFGLEFGRRCDAAADLFRREELTQLHVWCLWHSLECGQTEGMPSEGLRRRCHAEFTAQQGRPSRLQRHVGAALFRLVGSRPREEVTIPEGYSLDYLVEWRGARVAVEVDGPSHYAAASATASAAQHRAPSSATLLKRRQLRSFGWRLVSIPYFEWDQLHAAKGSTAELQRRYLAAALDEAVAETVVAGVS